LYFEHLLHIEQSDLLDHQLNDDEQKEIKQCAECITMRRYACMALTNLTFGDRQCKSILCNQPDFLRSLLEQLSSTNEELLQVSASLLRNLSWRPLKTIRLQLQALDTAGRLMRAALRPK